MESQKILESLGYVIAGIFILSRGGWSFQGQFVRSREPLSSTLLFPSSMTCLGQWMASQDSIAFWHNPHCESEGFSCVICKGWSIVERHYDLWKQFPFPFFNLNILFLWCSCTSALPLITNTCWVCFWLSAKSFGWMISLLG